MSESSEKDKWIRKKGRSNVWEHVLVDSSDKTSVMCGSCPSIFKYSGWFIILSYFKMLLSFIVIRGLSLIDDLVSCNLLQVFFYIKENFVTPLNVLDLLKWIIWQIFVILIVLRNFLVRTYVEKIIKIQLTSKL